MQGDTTSRWVMVCSYVFILYNMRRSFNNCVNSQGVQKQRHEGYKWYVYPVLEDAPDSLLGMNSRREGNHSIGDFAR
jgi:hypothetical protein